MGKLPQIWQYPPNQIDEVRRAYLKWGPYQMRLENYPLLYCLDSVVTSAYFE